MRSKRQLRELSNLLSRALTELRMGIESGSDCGPANREVEQSGKCQFQALDVTCDEVCPTAHFLIDCERRRVLKMSAANLNDSGKLLRLFGYRVVKFLNAWNEFVQLLGSSDVHRCRERVV